MSERQHVVVVGGGFAGLNVVRSLRKADVDITLLDRHNHHLFQPLLYQVATGGLSPANIAAPLRSVFRRQKNCEVQLAEVTGFDPDNRKVILKDGELAYDMLVVATGAEYNYFGRDRWKNYAPGLKSIEDALEIRRRILSAFENAERELNPIKRRQWLTFVIVGAGPTGTELAGTLAEIARHTLKSEFRHIDPSDARILLVDAGPAVLSSYPPKLSDRALADLEKRNIDVRTNQMVTEITPTSVTLKCNDDVEKIACHTIIWAAGVQGSPLGNALAEATDASTDRSGRLIVEPDLRVPKHPEIFVIGDLARVDSEDGQALPGLAPVAIQEGKYVASVIQSALKNEQDVSPFRYKDRGTMATIGRGSAIADIKGWKFTGFMAWMMWLVIHLIQIVQFQNRLLVLFQWAWNYITFNRSARLITGVAPNWETTPRVEAEQETDSVKSPVAENVSS
ncbi:NAD(P)/FAD-dependent oxidoreductase [Thalassoroseus pseudoceratinae]|uniref:NAD(P)/FAD-dependent oxidoreductase n=1 Tax=Thalassoroseus pseudoceratinae TaxID=2713176 RepID=UPI00141D800D|nr:NAD(P)/FAD-dependent oxidoreductase [Thalassoroseus pseudoceratinae]